MSDILRPSNTIYRSRRTSLKSSEDDGPGIFINLKQPSHLSWSFVRLPGHLIIQQVYFVYVKTIDVRLNQRYLYFKQAVGQFGLFAMKKIPPRTHLLDYLGEVHCDDRPSSDYDLSLYRTSDGLINVGVDASAMGNEGRFLNDYRGIRARPNAQFEERRADNGELRMGIWTGSEVIRKGEEILVRGRLHLNTLCLTVFTGELRQVVVEPPTTARAIVVNVVY